jgi:aminoglycoside 6'-N-acetyltransferase I
MADIRILSRDDRALLDRVDPDVFDDAVDTKSAALFLDDPRHILGVALDGDLIVGFVSAVEYFHPDKSAPELWINEVGVAGSHRRQGLAQRILSAVLDEGRKRGCTEAWVLTDRDNNAAMGLYASAPGALPPSDQVMFTFKLT